MLKQASKQSPVSGVSWPDLDEIQGWGGGGLC